MTTVLRKSASRPPASVSRRLAERLQQQVEHRRVGLLDFVEQQHAERLLADLRGEQALRVPKPPPTSRRTLTGSAYSLMSNRVSRSCEPNRNSARAFASLRLADAGGADEQQRRDRPVRPRQARLHRREQIDDQVDRFRLADDARGEPVARVARGRAAPPDRCIARGSPVSRVNASYTSAIAAPARAVAVADQVVEEPQRPAGVRGVGGVAAVQAVHGRECAPRAGRAAGGRARRTRRGSSARRPGPVPPRRPGGRRRAVAGLPSR